MEIYLVRHGRMCGDPHQFYEPPVTGCLSDLGVRQAEALAEGLSDTKFDYIYSSPLGRALQTAQPLAQRQGVQIKPLAWLREWMPAEQLADDSTRFETMMKSLTSLRLEETYKTVAGEGTFEMAHRIIPPFIELMRSHGLRAGHGGYILDNPEDATRIALFAHGGSLGTLLSFILGLPPRPLAPLAFRETGVAVITFVPMVDVWYPQLRIEPPYRPILME